MNRKVLIFWLLLISVSISIFAVGFVFLKSHPAAKHWMRDANEKLETQNRVYVWTPFYFPFRESATAMFTTGAFTEDTVFAARHNSQGFRTPEYTTAHPPNTIRILVLGDSFTWGQGVTLEETYAYVADGLLQKRFPNVNVEIIANGVCGHRFIDQWIKLLVHGASLKPDAVVVQLCPNDVDFHDYLSIYQFQRVNNPGQEYARKEAEVYEDGSRDHRIFVEGLQALKRWSETNQVPVYFVIFPVVSVSQNRNFDHYDPTAYNGIAQIAGFEKIVQEVRDYEFPTLYLLETFREKAGDEFLAVSNHDGHPNGRAHGIAAEALVNLLYPFCAGFTPRPPDGEWQAEAVLRREAASGWNQFHQDIGKQLVFYRELRTIYPRNAWIAMQLGFVYQGLKKWQESYEAFKEISVLEPQTAAPWFQMALNRGTDTAERLQLLEEMIRRVPDHFYTLSELTNHYLAQGKTQKACDLLKRQLEIPVSERDYQKSQRLYKDFCTIDPNKKPAGGDSGG